MAREEGLPVRARDGCVRAIFISPLHAGLSVFPPGTVTLRVELAHCCIRGSALDTLPGT